MNLFGGDRKRREKEMARLTTPLWEQTVQVRKLDTVAAGNLKEPGFGG